MFRHRYKSWLIIYAIVCFQVFDCSPIHYHNSIRLFFTPNGKKTYTHFGPLHFSLVTSNSFLPNLNGLNNLKSFGFIFKNKHSKINSNHPICHLKIKLDSSSQNVNFRKWYKSDYVLRGHKNSKVKELLKAFQMKLFWSFFELNNFVSFNLIFKTIPGVF